MKRENAIKLHDSRFWEKMEDREVAEFQIMTDRLCMPFDVFHTALEKSLGRLVWSHELALNYEGLKKELFCKKETPTLEQVINLIPEEKRIIVLSND